MEPLVNREDLQPSTLEGPLRDNPEPDSLAILHLDNRLNITILGCYKEKWTIRRGTSISKTIWSHGRRGWRGRETVQQTSRSIHKFKSSKHNYNKWLERKKFQRRKWKRIWFSYRIRTSQNSCSYWGQKNSGFKNQNKSCKTIGEWTKIIFESNSVSQRRRVEVYSSDVWFKR